MKSSLSPFYPPVDQQRHMTENWRRRLYSDFLKPAFLPILTMLGAVAVVTLLLIGLLLLD